MNNTKLTVDDVKHTAKLANFSLTAEELARFQKQLGDTLSYIQKLQEVDTQNIEPTAQVTGLVNVTREDEVKQGLTQEEALANAPDSHNGFFKVKAVFGEE